MEDVIKLTNVEHAAAQDTLHKEMLAKIQMQ